MLHPVVNYQSPGGRVYNLYRQLSERPHLLIAGATGSGKSVALNGIICTLLTMYDPTRCNLCLIDPKKVELIQYKNLPHTAMYASEPTDIIRSLHWAVDETERRFSCMQKNGTKEYDGPHLYVIVDELADLMTSMKKESLPPLQRLAQIGRAARVHVMACTQNVLAVTIPTVLKCNFPTILGLRTATAQQSRFLIATAGCEMLPDPKREGKGYGFLRDGADLQKYSLYMYPEEDIQQLVNYWTTSACMVG